MKFCLILLAGIVVCAGWPGVAAVSPDTVVATVDGRKLTAADIDRILMGAPADLRENLRKNPKQFVEQYALVSHLAAEGEREGLIEKSPYKEQWAWNRMQVMLQAAIATKGRELRQSGLEKAAAEEQLKKWLDSVRDSGTVEVRNEEYFSGDLAAAAAVGSDVVVAEVNGEPVTAGLMKASLSGAASQVRDNFQKSRRQFFKEYAMMLRLVDLAEQQKLEKVSPFREQLAWVRMNTLMQARLNTYSDSINIGRKEEQAYYQAHLDKYTRAKVRVIYVSYGSGDAVGSEVDGKKILSADEAKTRVESIRKKLAEGADFVEMVKQYSEDERSRGKDGEFGSIHKTDKIPEQIKEAIFSLKAGEVSGPVRQPNGFYLFRVDEIGTQSIDEVRQTMNRDAKSEKFNEWFNSVRESIKITFENEEYFAKPAGQ